MNQKRILIVDDEVPFTRLLKLGLEKTSRFLVQVENHPRDALARAEQFLPDIILLDVMMPQLDGGDLAVQLQASPKLKSVPIVFLTAAVQKEEVTSRGGHIGGFRFLAKPVSLPELIRCLDQF